jgi:RNA-directed DNA polymerase
VTQVNQGKRTPGVDKVLVKTPKARGKLVDELGTLQPWRAKPTKRVYIPKASGKLRPLGIPVIRDRALQAMIKNALEPSWEARFEATSYGFRPGRGCHDALERLHVLLDSRRRMRWVVDADIEGAFDNIDHDFLLETIGQVPGRELIRQWLKAGYVETFRWHPTEAGTPQGGVISPLLANIALHGMEEAVGMLRTKWGFLDSRKCNVAIVRYADDFVVTCTTREEAERAIERLIPWLAERGLTLSKEKTRIVHIKEGFDFLGFNIRQYDEPYTKRRGIVLLQRPSRDSVLRIRKRLRDEWLALHSHSVKEVIIRLNPIIRGWANYFRTGASSQTFHALDHWMYRREFQYAEYMHPGKSRYWKQARYWGKLHRQRNDYWVFGDKQTGIALLKFSWFSIQRHALVTGTSSPDDPALQEYWSNRQRKAARALPPSHRKIAHRQEYVCETCGEPLVNGEELQVHHEKWRSLGGKNGYENLHLKHLYCHQQIHARRKP